MAEKVIVSKDGPVVVITVNRPDKRNALDGETARALAAAVDEMDADDSISVGVLTGAGGTFCAGMDLAAFLAGDLPEIPGRGLGGITVSPPTTPLIAAVEGYALAGGFELMLACDLVVAARDAQFGLPEASLGLVAGAGGLIRLPARVPRAIAMQLILTADRITAEVAERWGLVNRLTDTGGALDGAVELAQRIARNAPMALRESKRVVAESPGWPTDEVWSRQGEKMRQIMASADAREGAQAFAERRTPQWTGH